MLLWCFWEMFVECLESRSRFDREPRMGKGGANPAGCRPAKTLGPAARPCTFKSMGIHLQQSQAFHL